MAARNGAPGPSRWTGARSGRAERGRLDAVRNARLLVLACCVATFAPACFLGYDSRWGEAKRAQQRLAAQSVPEAISASAEPDAPPESARRTWRVRVRPDGMYLAQNMDAPRQIESLLEDAGRILGPAIGLELVLDRVQPWNRDADDRLEDSLAALARDDAGGDVDLVVGMVGSLPRQTDSLHNEGLATLLGKYVVVRGPSRAGEHDAIEQAFSELSEDDRARLSKQRKHHRALAVLLHEIGHCLGAIHETEVGSLMAPAYDAKMAGFGGGAIALMRPAVGGADRMAVAGAQLALLENATNAAWVQAERDAEVARLRALITPGVVAPTTAATTGVVAASTPDAPAELAPDGRDRFLRAQQLFRAGAVAPAYESAKPLFTRYPDVYAVQDLRCQLATVRWLPHEQMLAECAPVGRLTGDAGAVVRSGR